VGERVDLSKRTTQLAMPRPAPAPALAEQQLSHTHRHQFVTAAPFIHQKQRTILVI